MKSILVVDDNKIYRSAVCQLLKQLGFSVYETNNGVDGKRLICEHQIDLAMMDLVLPQLDGFALCRWIKRSEECAKIPVIVCSHKNQETDKYWSFKQGADYFISKPMNAQQIIQALERLLHIKVIPTRKSEDPLRTFKPLPADYEKRLDKLLNSP